MIGDAAQDIGQPFLWIDTVEFGGLDQGVGHSGGFAAPLGAHEQVILATDGKRAHGPLGGVVVQLQKTVLQIGAQVLHAVEAITDGPGQRCLAGYFPQLGLQPNFQFIKGRLGLFLADGPAFIGRFAASALFYFIEFGYSFQGLVGNT